MLPFLSYHELLPLSVLVFYRGTAKAVAYMLLDVDCFDRENWSFFRSVPDSKYRDRLDFLFEIHRHVFLYKDADSKMTKKIFVF